MFGALEFSDKMAGYGIQPIIGCELAVDFGDQDPNARNALAAAPARIVLLAARERGYRSLMRLNSRAFLETPVHQAPHIKFEWLRRRRRGPDRADRRSRRADFAGDRRPIRRRWRPSRCDRLASLFGDRLYVELQRHGIEKERRVEAGLIDLAYAKGLPLVATNEPYFATTDDYEAHDALLCIAGGRLDRRDRSRAADARSPLQDPRRNGGAVRRHSGGAGLHRRDRRALLVPPGDAQADPAALHGRRRQQCRGCGKRRGGRIAPPGRGGARQPPQGPRAFAGHHRGGLSRAACLRDRRHHPHELCGLLPDRRRLHQMGEGRRAFRSDRAAAPARARWSPMR